MQTISLTHSAPPSWSDAEPCVMALGFFDGVHIGHQNVIRAAKEIAENRNAKLAVMTFHPHPKEVLSQGKETVNYLTPLEVKEEIFEKLGVEKLYVIQFDLRFAALSPKEFVNRYIIGLKAEHVVAGFDFTYGHLGQGNMKTIEADGMGKYKVTTIPKVEREGRKVSSTLIRELLHAGNVKILPQFLGDFYETRGEVSFWCAKDRGRESIKAEISTYPHYTLPPEGTYEIQVLIDNHLCQGISHVLPRTNGSPRVEIEFYYPFKKIRSQTIKIKWINRLSDCTNAGSLIICHENPSVLAVAASDKRRG